MAATVITIAVEKGGCGKTVTTSNLAYLMGDEGKKVLCLDTDPQGNLTFALTGGNAITSKAFANRSLYDMIDGFRYNTQTRDFIVESEYENVDLIPANDQTPRLSKRLEDLYTDAVDHIIQTAVGKGPAGNGVAACKGKRQVALRVGVQAKHLFALVAHQIGKVRGRYGFSAAAFFHRNGYYCCSHSLVPHFIM
jgi:Mrp family chromosome partitioning ATPase